MVSRLAALFLLCIPAFGQSVTVGPSTVNPNQTSISTSYLYYNKLHYAGTWSSTATYSAQDLVIYSGASYVSIQVLNVGKTPSTSPLWWALLPGSGIPSPPSTGTNCFMSISGSTPAWLSCSGGTTGQSWAALTSSVWAGITSTTWGTLVP